MVKIASANEDDPEVASASVEPLVRTHKVVGITESPAATCPLPCAGEPGSPRIATHQSDDADLDHDDVAGVATSVPGV